MKKRFAIVGDKGNNVLPGTPLRDIILGKKGDDVLDGGDGDDVLIGGNGDDTLLGGAGNDLLLGGKGDDFLNGGAGSDRIFAGKGDDIVEFVFSENVGAHDYYDGGKGFDTLRLTLTSAEFQIAKEDIKAFEAFLETGSKKAFYFESLGLTVRNFEDIVVTNIAPEAVDDVFAGNEDAPSGGNVLLNDTDVEDGRPSVVASVNGDAGNVGATITLGSGALLTVYADGTFTYDPNGQFETLSASDTFEDSFTYVALDSEGAATGTATAKVVVQGANDRPVAQADSNTTDEDTPVASNALTNVLANDSDVDNGDSLRVGAVNGNPDSVGVQITLPSGALLTLNEDGSYLYDPNGRFEHLNAGQSTTDTFTYVAIDSQGASSDITKVDITITGVDDAPAALRVAVVGGTASINNATAGQLNDSTVFNFNATALLTTAFVTLQDWQAAFGNFDVVVLGDDGDNTLELEGTQIFAALSTFLDQGGGVVTTGRFAGLSFIDFANADKITPAALPTNGEFRFVTNGSPITVNPLDAAGEAIAGGITGYAAQGFHEVAHGVDGTATILAVDASNRPAIAYDDFGATGGGRTVYLGSMYMGGGFFDPPLALREPDSPTDQLLERAVAWASGGGSTTSVASNWDASGVGDTLALSSTPAIDDGLL